jgi:para-nitrobenzyl esterase
MSVATILSSPRAQGLFTTAIAQSGAAHNASSLDHAAEVTARVLDYLGLKETDADALLSISVDELMAAQSAIYLSSAAGGGPMTGAGLPFQPVAGTPTVPTQPIDAIRGGSARDVRVVTGTTTDEFKLFGAMLRTQEPLDTDTLRQRAVAAIGERGAEIADVYTANRPGQSADDVWSAIVTDYVFRIPAVRLLEAQLSQRDDVFLYEFGHKSTAFGGALGACHAIEIPFVFDNVHRRGVDAFVGEIGEREHALAKEVNTAWITAASGDEPWERYDTTRRATRRFGGDTPGILDDPAGDERALWDGLR